MAKGGIVLNEEKRYLIFTNYYRTAMAAEILRSCGIPGEIVKAPAAGGRGCSFAVLVRIYDEERSIQVLKRKNNMPISVI